MLQLQPPTEHSLDAFRRAVGQRPSLESSEELAAAIALRAELDPSNAPIAAHLLWALKLDGSTLAAVLLVPLRRAGPLPASVEAKLSPHTLQLLDRVERLANIRWKRVDEGGAETLRRMFIALAEDLRAVVAVLALRVETLSWAAASATAEECEQLGRETLDVYAPLANRLGIWQLKLELENRALSLIDPAGFQRIVSLLHETQAQRDEYIRTVLATLEKHLAESGLAEEITGRSKHIYSIYKKMQKKHVDFEQLHDISAVRILAREVSDCYALVGLVHSLWSPLPGYFKDYIALPKDNGYQSLHTVVMGPAGRAIEVQIRTRAMHQMAEQGVAAHWAYKESSSTEDKTLSKFLLLRRLLDWHASDSATGEREVSETMTTDLFEDQVYVFTPKGDVLALPTGSTPLDFAYRVHTEVGHRCRGARINGQIAPLDHKLKNGDRVEVLTQKESRPRQDWLGESSRFLKTASARAKVRAWFKEQGRDDAIRLGREMVSKELARLDLKHTELEDLWRELGYADEEELYRTVGQGDKRPLAISNLALDLERRHASPTLPPSVPPPGRDTAPGGITLEAIENIEGARAGCCQPVPGDDVIGFITRGRGVIVHRRDCAQIRDTTEPERLVEIGWGRKQAERFAVHVEVIAHPRPDLLAELCRHTAQAGVEVVSASARPSASNMVRCQLGLTLLSAEQLSLVLARLSQQPYVSAVRRCAD